MSLVMLSYYLYRLAGWILPHIPPAVGYWLAERLGDLIFLLNRRARRVVCDNMAHVLGEKAETWPVARAAQGVFRNQLRNYFDLFRLPAFRQDEIEALLRQIHGWEYIEQALQGGKGLILVSAHFGNTEIVLRLAGLRIPGVLLPAERLEPEKLFQYVRDRRASRGIVYLPIDGPMLSVFRALRRNQIVCLAADRDVTGSGIEVPFFGAPAQLPDGAVQLALRTGAKIVVGFSIRWPDNTFDVYLEPPLDLEESGDFEADVRAGMAKLVAIMERYIGRYPQQWVLLRPVWRT